MIKEVLITGDKHGYFGDFQNLKDTNYWNDETAIIVLGDFSINYYLNKKDYRTKTELTTNYPFYFYIIRGNHEARPENLPGIIKEYDENVGGEVYYEPEFPRLRYFMNYGIYSIKGYNCLIIGGAYSVDKYYRLMRAGIEPGEKNNPKRSGWFDDEQLTIEEMRDCDKLIEKEIARDGGIDFVMTHTCPYSLRPLDLFLSAVNQSTVDNTMEKWMEVIKNKVSFGVWLFGHYHADRIESPYVEQYYHNIENIDDIWRRWDRYSQTGELDWWLNKGALFYENKK